MVVDARRQLGFTAEALHPRLDVEPEARRVEDLEGDVTAKPRVVRQVHPRLTSAAEFALDLVAPDRLRGGHRSRILGL